MRKLPVGIQVFGLRDLLADTPENFEEVMKQIKEIGYDGVELAGLYGIDPQEIHDILEKVGLIPISAHIPVKQMLEDIDKVIRDYKTIGITYATIPALPEEFRPNHPGYTEMLEKMKEIGQKMKDNGLRLMYHNHEFEFVTLENGRFGFDDMYAEVPEELMAAEPDTCWIRFADQDPASYIRKYGARCEIVHLKDFVMEGMPARLAKLKGFSEEDADGMFEFRPVGFGQQIWEPILDAAVEAGSKWVVVEQDRHYDLPPVEAARRSREYLKILGW